MRNSTSKVIALTTLALLLVSTAPAAFGSTLTIDLNPTTKVAKVTSVSVTHIVLTYPVNTTLSDYLKGVNSSLKLNGTFQQGEAGVEELQGSFADEGSHVSVQNMTVSIDYSAKGNATALVIDKETSITAWVTGVFSVVNGTVKADLKWRSFVIVGALNLNFGDHMMDVNQVGPAMEDSLAEHTFATQYILGAFGGATIWHRPTLNFSQLNSPLTTWTKNFDSSTNTTTFSKTISGNSTFKASLDIDGKVYTLSATSDPSAAVNVKGYASASGDSLTLQAPPAGYSPLMLVAAAAGAAVIAALAYAVIRAKAKPRVAPTVTAPAIQ